MNRFIAALLLIAVSGVAHAQITFVGCFSVGANSGTGGTNIGEPTGAAEGDLLFALATGNQTASWDTTAGDDFTEIDDVQATTGSPANANLIAYRFRGASAGTNTITHSGSSGQWQIHLCAFRGVHATTPIDVTYVRATHYNEGASTGANPAAQAITTVTNNAWVILAENWSNTTGMSITGGAPTNYTLRQGPAGSTASGRASAIASREITTAGAQTPGVWTHSPSGGADDARNFTIALRPSAAAPSGITLTSVAAGTPCATFNAAVNPDISAGDILVPPGYPSQVSTPGGHAVAIGVDCAFSYADTAEGRESLLNVQVYDTSASGYHASDIDFVDRNTVPVCDYAETGLLWGVTAVSEDFGAVCADADGDALTYALAGGSDPVPAGTTLSSAGLISGTTTTENEAGDTMTIQASDDAGDSSTFQVPVYVVNTKTLPDYVASTQAAAISAHDAAFPWQLDVLGTRYLAFAAQCDAAPANHGKVLSQSVAATTEVSPTALIVATIGQGCAKGRRRVGAGLGLGGSNAR